MFSEKEKAYIKEFHSIQKERNEKYMVYVKTVTPMAIGFLGIMLSLADTDKMNCMKHLFYSITITATALGILASLITSFGEILSLTDLRNNIRDKALQLKDGIDNGTPPETDIKWFEIFHYIWVVSFVCALVSATLYSWF
ncbi:hypothetical protein ACNQGB_04765 [Flavobacterium sp. XS1P32]|uniref:hypothetical protein n=1 Tax=Flavobacterium sp. XS1P32 TaxID=3401726 RepID=UPI003AADD980